MAKPTPEPAPAERLCFFVTPLGDDNSSQRARANDVMDYILNPALQQCGYTTPPLRADQMPHPGRITRQIIDQLINAELVVADLTDHNPNVFYELAIRHAVRKPVVQIIHVKDKIPFDVANQRTIFYNHESLRSAHEAQSKIVEQIRAAEADPGDVDTPLTEALLMNALSQSADPVAQSNVEIMSVLQNLQTEMVYLRRQLRSNRTNVAPAKAETNTPAQSIIDEYLATLFSRTNAQTPQFWNSSDFLPNYMKLKAAEGEEAQEEE